MYDDSQRFHGTAAVSRDQPGVVMKALPATPLRATSRGRLRRLRRRGLRDRLDLLQQLRLDRRKLAVTVVPGVLDAIAQEAALLDRPGDRHLRPATSGLELRVDAELRLRRASATGHEEAAHRAADMGVGAELLGLPIGPAAARRLVEVAHVRDADDPG